MKILKIVFLIILFTVISHALEIKNIQSLKKYYDTSNWNTYYDSKYDFIIKYPGEFKVLIRNIDEFHIEDIVMVFDIVNNSAYEEIILRFMIFKPLAGSYDTYLKSEEYLKKVCSKYNEFELGNRKAVNCCFCAEGSPCQWRIYIYGDSILEIFTPINLESVKEGPQDGVYPILSIINSLNKVNKIPENVSFLIKQQIRKIRMLKQKIDIMIYMKNIYTKKRYSVHDHPGPSIKLMQLYEIANNKINEGLSELIIEHNKEIYILNKMLMDESNKIPIWAYQFISIQEIKNEENDSFDKSLVNSKSIEEIEIEINELENKENCNGCSDNIKFIKKKKYLWKNKFWIDVSCLENEETIDIKFASKEYYDLLKNNPELEEYLSVGRNEINNYKEKNYKINVEFDSRVIDK
ncbi:MAG: hypothetical protein HY934_09565 [Candidatus Firestonebacteria bacterium]|nr:hypothetical protein [Candidatus Firestonebacteria bacterium]